MIPVKLRLRDDELAVDRLRGVGFRAVSSSGWEGPTRKVRQDAVADMCAHRAENVSAASAGGSDVV